MRPRTRWPPPQTFGAGCAGVPTSGDGSFDGMATAPVATAASANPLLKTLVTAVDEAGLVDTLNSAPRRSPCSRPTDDAFAEIPTKDLNALLKDKETLTTVLTHHVVAEQLTPDQLAGEHETLAGDMLTIEGSGEDFTIDDDEGHGALRQHPDRQRHRLRRRHGPDAGHVTVWSRLRQRKDH